jgi:hypothetical protein
MFSNEARWIAKYFSSRSNEAIGTVLNIGSSTADYRERTQPFIDEQIFQPLLQRGVPVIHSDIKADDGVDAIADIMNDSDLERLRRLNAKTIICSNMLEHVPAPAPMAERLASLVPPGGVILVTVPNSFPYHPDPIDNLLRPDASQLGRMFAQLRMVEGSIIEGPTVSQEIMREPSLFPRRVARSLLPFPRIGPWLSALDWWRWLFRHYKATCVVLSRPLATEANRPMAHTEGDRAAVSRLGPGHAPSTLRPGPLRDTLKQGFERAGYPLLTASPAAPGLIEVYPHPALLGLAEANECNARPPRESGHCNS